MATDIKLDEGNGNTLLLEADVVKTTGADFVMDSAARRSTEGGIRRALVHDQRDGLTINFNGDYPGGVTMVGVAEITPKDPGGNILFRGGILCEVLLGGGDKTTGLPDDKFGPVGEIPYFLEKIDLVSKILQLEAQITELQNKVAALEARP